MAKGTTAVVMTTSQQESPEQIVMEFFQQGIPITETPRDVALKKSNAAIKTVSALGLLEQKVIDACIFVARPKILTQGLHAVDMDYFKWLLSFNSKNNDYLKKSITKVQQTLIQINIYDDKNPDKDFWHSTPFIYDVSFSGGKVFFRVPESLHQNIADPKTWTLLSFRIKNKFTSVYAYTLYQRCRSDQFRGATDWWTVDDFREIMNSGQPDLYTKFQDLQKRVIKPAVEQINKFSDILVTPDFRRRGRTITHIRFLIETNPAVGTNIDEKERLPAGLFDTLKNQFGLANSQIDELAVDYDPSYLADKVEFTRFRMTKQTIGRPDLYLIKALKEDLRFNAADSAALDKQRKALEVVEAKADMEKGAELIGARNMEAIEAFNQLDKEQQQAIIEAFQASSFYDPVRKMKGMEFSLDRPLVRSTFVRYLLEVRGA